MLARSKKIAALKRVYLIGPMGAGKTSVGRALAERLGWPFIDLDNEVAERADGLRPAAIFERFGEAYFRAIERAALRATFGGAPAVIATGGGTAIFFDNFEQMSRHGQTVFLDAPLVALIDRLAGDRDERPLLHGLGAVERAAFLEKMLAERRPFYERASIRIDASAPATELAERLAALILK